MKRKLNVLFSRKPILVILILSFYNIYSFATGINLSNNHLRGLFQGNMIENPNNYFIQLNRQLSFIKEVDFINPVLPQLVICGNEGTASIEIVKLANGSTMSNAQLRISLDEGLKFKGNYRAEGCAGPNSNVVYRRDLSTARLLVFDFPDMNFFACRNIVFSFDLNVDCDILDIINATPGVTFNWDYALIHSSGTDLYTEKPIPQFAKPQLNISNPIINPIGGTLVSRRFTVCQTGVNAYIQDTMHIYDFGAHTMHIRGVKINGGAEQTSYVSGSNGNQIIKIPTAEYQNAKLANGASGNRNNRLDGPIGGNSTSVAECIEVEEIIDILSCVDLSSDITAYWSCEARLCEPSEKILTNITLDVSQTPRLEVMESIDEPLCLGGTDSRLIQVRNAGGFIAKNPLVKVYIFSGTINSEANCNGASLNPNSFQISVNGGAFIPATIYSKNSLNCNSFFDCYSENISTSVILQLPDMNAGDQITIRYEKKICCPGSLGYFYNLGDAVRADYFDFCNNKYALSPVQVSNADYYVNSLLLNENLASIHENSKLELKYIYYLHRLSKSTPESEIEINIQIPNGLSFSRNVNDVMWIDPYGRNWLPTTVIYSANIVSAKFKIANRNPLTFNNSEIRIKNITVGDCNQMNNPTAGLKIVSNIKYFLDPTCACGIPLSQDTLTLFPICEPDLGGPNPCIGVDIKSTTVARTSIGLKDSNSDQKADANITADPNADPINLFRVMTGDRFRMSYTGVVNDDASRSNVWPFGSLESSFEIASNCDVADASIRIYDQSNTSYITCHNIPVVRRNSTTFVFDFSKSRLLLAGCGDPNLASFDGFTHGDSLFIDIDYAINRNNANSIIQNKVINNISISKVDNPSSGQQYNCGASIGRFNYYGYGARGGLSTVLFNGCEEKFIQFDYHYYNQSFDGSSGYDLFPFEYRPQNILDIVNIDLPLGYNFVRADAVLVEPRGRERNESLIEPIIPTNLSGRILHFDIGSKFKSKNALGPWDAPDDSYFMYIQVYLAPDCNITEGSVVHYNYSALHQGSLTSIAADGGNTSNEDDLSNSGTTNGNGLLAKLPNLSVQSAKQTNNGVNPTVSWPVKINNIANETEAKNVFINFINTSGFIRVNRIIKSGIPILPNANGIFELGNLTSGGSELDITVEANYSLNCTLDSLVAQVGWDCKSYPSSRLAITCPTSNLSLYVKPFSTAISAAAIFPRDQNPPIIKDLCEDIEFVIQVDNIGQADALNILFDAFMPSGFEIIPNSSYIQYPINSNVPPAPNVNLLNWRRITDATDRGADPLGRKFQWNVTNLWNTATGTNGLGGIRGEFPYQLKDADSSKFYIRFLAQTKCGFPNATRIPYRASAQSPCQVGTAERENSITGFSAPIQIIDPNTLYSGRLAIGSSSSSFNACSDFNDVDLVLYNFGPGSTRLTDTIKITIPNGYSYIPSSTSSIRNFVARNPTIIAAASGATTLAWAIGTVTSPGDSVKFKFRIDINPSISTCNSVRNFLNMVITTRDLVCADDGSVCRTQLTLAEANHPTVYSKASYVLLNQNTTCPDVLGQTFTTLRLSVRDVALSARQNIKVRIFEDLNRNGILDATDTIAAPIASHIVNGPISIGNLTMDFGYLTTRDRLRNAIVLIDGTCSCFPLISRLYPPICTACVPIGDYVWHDANRDGIQNTNEEGINGVTVQLYEQNGVLFSTKVTARNPLTGKDGYYKFCTCEGVYYLKFSAPSNYSTSPERQGGDRTLDSDVSNINGLNTTVTFTAREGDMWCDFDAGFYRTTSLRNLIWIDNNEDGVYQPRESGFADVDVSLIDYKGSLIETTKSDKNGNFAFNKVSAGIYFIQYKFMDQYVASGLNNNSKIRSEPNADGYNIIHSDAISLTKSGFISNQSIGLVRYQPITNNVTLQANFINEAVLLHWDVLGGINPAKFIIERKDESNNVTVIDEIIPSNNLKNSFYYADKNVQVNKTYTYQIKLMYNDGSIALSNRTNAIIPSNALFTIKPTVVIEDLILTLQSDQTENAIVTILDINGNEVKRQITKWQLQKANNTKDIKVRNLTSGLYICAVRTDSGKVYYQEFMKQ